MERSGADFVGNVCVRLLPRGVRRMTRLQRLGGLLGRVALRGDWLARPEAPAPEVALARERAFHDAREALADYLQPVGVRVSPLGAAWSSDVDVHLTAWPDDALLLRRGWLPLDALLGALGSRTRGRWAIVVEGSVVGAADLHLSRPPDPVEVVLDRSRRKGGAGPREVAELAELAHTGHVVASAPPRRQLRRLRLRVGAFRRHLRPHVVVLVTGGTPDERSAVVDRLHRDLELAGVPHSRRFAAGRRRRLPVSGVVVRESPDLDGDHGLAPGLPRADVLVRLGAAGEPRDGDQDESTASSSTRAVLAELVRWAEGQSPGR